MSSNFFDEFTNLYSLSKTLRFELKPVGDFEKDLVKEIDQFNISDLVEQFQSIQKEVLDIFVCDQENEKIEFRKKREIKYGWLRNYTKNDFYDWKQQNNINNRDKSYYLTTIDYLSGEFLRWIHEWNALTEKLNNLKDTEEHKKKRRSDIAFVIREFLKRQNFEFIYEFVMAVKDLQNIRGSESDKQIQKLRQLLKATKENLKACEKEYLPAQSAGVILHKASLNYYTLNKTPKEYGELKEKKEKELSKKIIDCKNKYGKPEFFFDRKFNFGENPLHWTLDEAYKKMKEWKAKQKSDFLEGVAGNKLTIDNFRDEFPLFDTSNENFSKLYKRTKELDSSPENAKKIAQDRGCFFNKPGEKVQTENYKKLCELYKRIAMKRGKILAEIKSLENEEVQSRLLDHWAVVLRENKKHFLVMIPRGEEGNHKNAHDFLNSSHFSQDENAEIVLYHFKSLTLRALEKLCFKEVGNTFMPALKKEGVFFPKYKEEWRKVENGDKKYIVFYKQVLQSNYVRKNLDIVDFGGLDNFLNSQYESLQEFESALEKICYVKVPLQITLEQKEEFIRKFDAKVFEITTRSISGDKKENKHARIWKDFWSEENKKNNHITRLNPECSIFYREPLNTGEGNRNRYSKEQFTLATTISLNATEKKSNLAFKTTQDIKDHIEGFNKSFNENFKGEWVYGIDRGLKELATLNVVKFSDKKNKFGVSQPEEFAEIEVWELKDENAELKDENSNILKNAKGENRKIIDNISEVLQEDKDPDEELFGKETVSSLDLTTAKLIKGHIIVNGDKKTYLKLKELSAKRRIFELVSTSKIYRDAEFSGNRVWSIGGYEIYWLCEWQRQNKWKEEKNKLQEELLSYIKYSFDNVKNENLEQTAKIEKINHLRDAITANMVGILFYLQKNLDMRGFIGLENLDTVNERTDKKMIDEHFDQSNQDISRRLEWALYRKFANTGDVPPQIKQSILLRDDFQAYQMGILKFVKVEGTSSNCPNCGETYRKTKAHFICKKDRELNNNKACEQFSSENSGTLLEKNLRNSDEVAAYNVARNTFDNIYN